METFAEVCLLVGAALTCLAGIGMVRLSDLYARMHAATKAPTLGIGLIGIGALILVDGAVAKVALAVVLITVTAPSAAHVIGRAAYGAEGVDLRLDGPDDLRPLVAPDTTDGEDPVGRPPAAGSVDAGPAGDDEDAEPI